MRALIFGITGQDGSYLAEILLENGYEVYGVYRRTSTGNLRNIQRILDKITLIRGDLTDSTSIVNAIQYASADEIYNEADQDNVGWSFDLPAYSAAVTYGAVGVMLEEIKTSCPETKFFQPVSATMFGDCPPPQDERSSFSPQSPYACAKLGAYHLVRYYRESYGMFASSAIMFNHDSPRRSEEYLLHKICASALRIKRGQQERILLGNLTLRVDIGYAREYMQAAHSMLQLDNPNDFVIGTRVGYEIQSLAEMALDILDLNPSGKISIDPEFNRSSEEPTLMANIAKATNAIGFAPKYHGFSLIRLLLSRTVAACHRWNQCLVPRQWRLGRLDTQQRALWLLVPFA